MLHPNAAIIQLDRDCSCGFLSSLNRHLESGRGKIYNRIPEKHRLDFEKFIHLEMFIFKIIPSPSSDALRKHITGL